MQISVSSTLTVYHDGQFWVRLAEHVEDGRYSAARIVFGAEPSNEEILRFVVNKWAKLSFFGHDSTEASKPEKNPKRRAREAAKALKQPAMSTKAQQALARVYVGTSRRERGRVPESWRFGPKRGGVSRAVCGGYAHGTAGGEVALRTERLRCCATCPLREGVELMLGYEEKLERIELIDSVCDAERLARGLDQLLESLAHADQLDPLNVEGILALRSISEKCTARIRDAARILEAQNEVLYAEERANAKPRENNR